VDAFLAFGEAADASFLSVVLELVPAAGDDFVGIGLVAYVPKEFVGRGVVNVVKGYTQFNSP
jgi:hypothetical protein